MINYQRESYIRMVRSVGESLIKNAESIVGTEEYVTGINISVHVPSIEADIPEIEVTKTFMPESVVKGLTDDD